MRNFLSFLLFFVLLASCEEAPKLSSISKIATTFDTGSTSYAGGVIVVGVRQDVPDTVSYSFINSSNSLSIEKGDWTFYAIGYSGPSKFTGTKSCGMTSASFRKGKSTSLNLNLSTDGCSGKLSRTLKIRPVYTHSCTINSDYITGSDRFTPPVDALLGTYCVSPAEQNDNISYYKISSLNMASGTTSTGFSSACINTSIFAPALDLPTEKMPLTVTFYKSSEECRGDATPHLTYNLTSGIAANYSSSFDKLSKELNPGNYQLFLPAALTKRMKSPFLGMIPRLNCGTYGGYSECSPEPLQSIHARVPWDYPLKNQLLLRNVTSPNCNGLTNNSKLFTIEDCKVINRSMYGTIRRNALTCRETPSFSPGSIVDLYERNKKVYILYRSGSDTQIAVYSDTGKFDHAFTVSSDHTFVSFAADDNGVLYAMAPTQIFKFEKNTSGFYTQTDVQFISNGSLIEVTPDGSHLFLAKNIGTLFEVYRTSDFNLRSSSPFAALLPINQIQFYKGILYSGHDTTNGGTPAGIIYRNYYNASLGAVSANTTNIGFENDINRFYITDNDRYYILHNSGVSYEYSINPATGDVSIIHGGGGGASLTNATSYIASNNIHYYSDGTNFKAYNVNTGGVWNVSGEYDGECGEDVTVEDGQNSQMISLQSYFALPGDYNNIHLFEAGMKLSGKKIPVSSDENNFLFPHLNENQIQSSAGGGLNRIQRMLGPHGIGGMFHDFATCTDLAAALSVGEINRNFSVDDPYTGFRTYSIHAKNVNGALVPYFCNDSDIAGSCNNNITLRFNVTSTGLFENEIFALKVNCDNKVGSMEVLKYDSDETRKELLFWNTNDNQKARYETIKSYKTNGYFFGEILKANKTGDEQLWGRNISIEKTSDLTKAKAVEYNRDVSRHRANFIEIQDTPTGFPTNTDYLSDRSTNSFAGPANLCLAINQTNMSTATIAGCTITNEATATSFGVSLSLDVLLDADDDTSGFQNQFGLDP